MSARQKVRGCENYDVGTVKKLLAAEGFWDGPISENHNTYTAKVKSAVAHFQQTHIDQNGRPLAVDGIVGPKTMWALKHPRGKAQANGLDAIIPDGLGPMRVKILETGLGERGVRERPMGSNRGPGVDRYLPGWAKRSKKGPPWCCFYVSWVGRESLGKYPLGRIHGSVAKMWAAAQEQGIAHTDVKNIQPGDIFVMLFEGGTGHTGFCLRRSANGKQINTNEGNCGNRVKTGTRATSTLAGYIRVAPTARGFEKGLLDGSEDVGGSTTR